MSQDDEAEKAERRQSLEDVAEDTIGLNFRSLRTFRDLIVRPNAVFRAYASGDRESYTPALRLWLFLISLQFVFSVIWGGHERALLQLPEDQAAIYVQLFNAPIEDIAEAYGQAAALLHAPIVGGMTALTVFLLAAFRPGLRWPARLNLTFAVLTTGSIFGVLAMPFVQAQPTNGAFAMIGIFLIYWITFTRGAPGVLADTAAGAWLKGLAFSVATLVAVIVGGVLMLLAALGAVALMLPGGGG